MTKQQQQKVILAILVGAIFLVLYYYLLIQPKLSRLGQLIPEVQQNREQLTVIKEDLKKLDFFKKRRMELEEERKVYQKTFPEDSDLSGLLNYLSNQAKTAGVTLSGIEPKKTERVSGKTFREIQLTLRAKGDYHSLGTFMNRLETGERMILVEGFQIISDAEDPREHPMRMDLKTYVD